MNGITESVFSEEHKNRILLLAGVVITQYGGFLDEMFWTPLRDLQVFGKNIFSSAFGQSHLSVDIPIIGVSLSANLLISLFKLLQEKEVNTLQDVLKNCETEFPKEKFFDPHTGEILENKREEISKVLKGNLEAEGIYEVEPVLKTKTRRRLKNGFREEKYVDVIYAPTHNGYFHDLIHSSDSFDKTFASLVEDTFPKLKEEKTPENVKNYLYRILESDELKDKSLAEVLKELRNRLKDNKQKRILLERLKNEGIESEKITAFARMIPVFSTNQSNKPDEYDLKRTIGQSREQFIDRLNKSNKIEGAYDFLNDVSFNFWLQFMVLDFFTDQSDTQSWSLKAQLAPIAVGIGLSIVKAVSQLFGKEKEQNKNKAFLAALAPDVDSSLKHRQLEYLFIQEQQKFLDDHVKKQQPKLTPELNKIIDASLETIVLESPSRIQRAKMFLFPDERNAEFHMNTIEEYRSSGNKITLSAEIASKGIGFSFIEWVGSASLVFGLACIPHLKSVALTIGSCLSGGWIGGVIAIGSAVLGLIVGATYYRGKKVDEIKSKKEQLEKTYNAKKTVLEDIKQLETQNAKLKKFIAERNPDYKLPPMLTSGDDKGCSHLTTKKSTLATNSTTWDYFSTFIAKVGSGILLYRTFPMQALPLLAKIAFFAKCAAFVSVTATISAAAWPAAVIAVGVGLIWAGLSVYNLMKQNQIKAAEEYIADASNRLLLAQQENAFLRKIAAPDVQKTKAPEKVSSPEKSSDQKVNSGKLCTNQPVLRTPFYNQAQACGRVAQNNSCISFTVSESQAVACC